MAKKEATEETQAAALNANAPVSRPNTEANVFIQLLVGLLGTLAVSFAVVPLKNVKGGAYVWGLINNRGPIQYIELFMAFMVAAQVFMKSRLVRKQLRQLYDNPIDTNVDLENDGDIQGLRKAIVQHKAYGGSIVLSRMERILSLWLATKDVGRISEWASGESTRDSSSSDSSYALARVLIWAIPIMGFIGTVQGLGSAVSGFADFLAGSAELSAIKGAIANVTIGLGVAFDTTFLALILVTLLMFPLSSVQRKEEGLFVEIDQYLDDFLISRLPSSEAQPIVIENLEDSIEAAFRRYIPDPDRYDEVFTRSIEKAAGIVEVKFNDLARIYEGSLREMTGSLATSIAGVGDSIEGSLRKVTGELQEQESALAQTRRVMAQEEREKLKGMLQDVYQSAQNVADQYKETAASMQGATQKSADQAIQAAREVGSRMESVVKMAKSIEDMLNIEKALEQSLAGLAAASEFQQTLSDLRGHLATTDAFCKRLSRPRVITFREESAS